MEFIKSLFVPLLMRRHRNMSMFISVGIFLVSIYLIIIPVQLTYKYTNKALDINGYHSKEIYNTVTDYDYNNILNNGYVIDAKGNSLTSSNKETAIFKIEGLSDNSNIIINLVFDFELESYNSNFDAFEKYNIEKENRTFIVLFASSWYEIQEAVNNSSDEIILEHVQGTTYKNCELDFNAYDNTESFLKGLGSDISKLYASLYISALTVNSLLMVFILPMILVLFMWVVLKKNGSLKTFKEYYNIASITSFAPTIIAFIVAWFWPQVVNFYTTAFVMYYLFVVYRINAFPIDYYPEKK